ncbi:hypothetical protein WOLCODRAFT_161193 [Wolfiporia cocos MD-104 SS10]|uniref:Uncharacterized protein n=1 Tax=Wolfiporia cocos (strain MD-104) TaxID=742152 RepID=A0A2H3J6X8_WOLCO|nr:hypothetical protein WOLCODRAFT_161193 [Wolfiporia cocos MD-104 SS10]
MRGTLEPAYPSFSLALSRAGNYTSRLPAYRESHRRRYHPYPRSPRRQSPDYLMNTVDYRYEDAFNVAASLLESPPDIIRAGEAGDLENLDRALHYGTELRPKALQRLTTLIVDLALAVRRRLAGMRSVKKLASTSKFDLLD